MSNISFNKANIKMQLLLCNVVLLILQSVEHEETGNRDGRIVLVPISNVTTFQGEHSEREGGNVASTVVNYQLRGNYGNRYKSRRRERGRRRDCSQVDAASSQ